jgi:hypothetical protein
MFKNAIIVILTCIVILFWLSADPEEYEDPNNVIIEYQCTTLDDYENVPPEVVEECRNRSHRLKKVDNKPTV